MNKRVEEINNKIDILEIERALLLFFEKAKSRLLQKQREGFYGWDDRETGVSIIARMEEKINILKEERTKGENIKKQCVDIANFAMMLHYQDESP